MKTKLLLLLTLFTLGFANKVEAQVKWMTMTEAIEAQKINKKPIFIDAYTLWCGPCKILDKRTFKDNEVINVLNKHYNPVKFNAEGNEEFRYKNKLYRNPKYNENRKYSRNSVHQFASVLKVKAYPSMIVLNYKGSVVKNIMGFHSAKQLLTKLEK